MDNLTQRRIVGIIGVVIALLGFASFFWGLLAKNSALETMGFFWIIIAYVLTLVIKKLKEKGRAEKAAQAGDSKLE